MQVLLGRLTFEYDSISGYDRAAFQSIADRIRSKFGVYSAVESSPDADGRGRIAIIGLNNSEQALERTLDQAAGYCESAGFGRVDLTESTVIDLDEFLDGE